MSRCDLGLLLATGTLAAALAACSSTSSSLKEPEDAASSFSGPCGSSGFDDRSAATAKRAVSFGGVGDSGPFSYSPSCMLVSAGQSVTFTGDFSVHPLTPGIAPGSTGDASAGNPIPSPATGQTPVSVTFTAPGTYPYFCMRHYAAGMVGAVEVSK